jgi:hypothetical protein
VGIAMSFRDWQPRYAEHRIATFLVRVGNDGKVPAIKGWGVAFADADSFGFLSRSRQRWRRCWSGGWNVAAANPDFALEAKRKPGGRRAKKMRYTMTNTDHDQSTNGSGASRPGDAADIFADLSALRLTPDEAGQIGSEEVLEIEHTRDMLLSELEEARKLALKRGQASAAVAATMGKAKICGLIIDRREVGDVGKFDSWTNEQLVEEATRMARELGITGPPLVEDDNKKSL